jgi:endonuclease YncB( thermonuclease family)
MKLTKLFLLLTLFVLLSTVPNYAQSSTSKTISDIDLSDFDLIISDTFPERRVTGKVVGVHDGDTAKVLDKDKKLYNFRFNGIDAPELKQDFGKKSKQHLSDLIFGKEVTVIFDKKDKYERFVGKIMVKGIDANLEQIKAGLAWHYKKYASEQSEADRKTYSDAEIQARDAKLGFWSMANITPAWDYRAAIKVAQEKEKANRKYLTGAKGGCYYINSNGNKTYVKKEFCNAASSTKTEVKTETKIETKTDNQPTKSLGKKDANGRAYIKGAKGGCYYINSNGNKSYVDKKFCANK